MVSASSSEERGGVFSMDLQFSPPGVPFGCLKHSIVACFNAFGRIVPICRKIGHYGIRRISEYQLLCLFVKFCILISLLLDH